MKKSNSLDILGITDRSIILYVGHIELLYEFSLVCFGGR